MTDAPRSGRHGREALLVGALAAAAALRVLVFSAAFPFFTNVDEHKHVDTVLKYARGYLPGPGADAFEPEMGQLVGTLGSPEYHLADDAQAPPAPWRRAPGAMLAKIERAEEFLDARANKEAFQPPLYYLTAAGWLRIGRLLGLGGGALLYWVRALGALALGALVLLCHRFLRDVYPGDSFIRLGVPALLVVFPQDALFYVSRDALSPLLAGAGFLLAVRVARAPESSSATYAATGLVTALACLTKYTNVVLLGVCALASVRVLRLHPARSPAAAQRLLLLWLLALAPIASWLMRNQLLFGDPTATAQKAQRLGWEPRPLADWLDHPLFTPSGCAEFVAGLVPKFWRGELVWRRDVLAWPPADLFYTLTTLVFLPLAALARLRGRDLPASRPTESAALAMLGLAVAVLATLSLLYVFPEVGNPSAARPWFDHGRLIAGALVPFLILYVRGLQVATSRLPARAASATAWSALACVAAVVLLSEIVLARRVFLSDYNWYHLP